MKLLMVEDHPIVRDGCRRLLQGRGGIELAEARSAAEALRLARDDPPALVLLDLRLPDMNGLDLLVRLREVAPAALVLVFSMYEDPALVARALEAGARGFITKNDDPGLLAEAIERVAAGEVFLGRGVAQSLALMSLRPGAEAAAGPHGLSPREREVMGRLAAGRSLAEIALDLGISYRSAANITATMRGRLGIPTTAGLIKFAVEQAALPAPPVGRR